MSASSVQSAQNVPQSKALTHFYDVQDDLNKVLKKLDAFEKRLGSLEQGLRFLKSDFYAHNHPANTTYFTVLEANQPHWTGGPVYPGSDTAKLQKPVSKQLTDSSSTLTKTPVPLTSNRVSAQR